MNNISDSAKIYRDVRIVNSEIKDNTVIADDCDLVGVIMEEHSEFGRRNLIRDTHIGYGSYTGHNTTIKNTEIGKYCCISWNVSIVGNAVHEYSRAANYSDYWLKRTFDANIEEETVSSRTVVGNDVWIGCNTVILSGLTIGDGAIIGAGAVVTKDVEPYSIVAGNPAKIIKKRFSDEMINRLLSVRWWDLSPEIIKDNIKLFRGGLDENILSQMEQIGFNNK